MRTFVIAEQASTHHRDLHRALRLVDLARQADANAVKIQVWSDSRRVAARLNAPELESMYESVRVPLEWLPILSDRAHALDLEFLATVDLPEDIPVVAPYVDRFKIASVEAHDDAFIAAHRGYGKPLILSTGMMGLLHEPDLLIGDALLHCVSGYPTPVDEANLAVIRRWGAHYPWAVGFSDHTAHVLTGAFAVCAGASILEVHVRASDTPPDNPDFPHSLTPAQFREYVANVRLAERMLGDGIKRIMPSERPTLRHRVTV